MPDRRRALRRPHIPADTPPPFEVADGRPGGPGQRPGCVWRRRRASTSSWDRARPRPRPSSGCWGAASTPTRSAGCGRATPGCSTGQWSSRIRPCTRAWWPTSCKRRPVPPHWTRSSSGSKGPVSCCASTGRSRRPWRRRPPWAPGSSTCCARSSTSSGWATSDAWSRGLDHLRQGVGRHRAGRARRALRGVRSAEPTAGPDLAAGGDHGAADPSRVPVLRGGPRRLRRGDPGGRRGEEPALSAVAVREHPGRLGGHERAGTRASLSFGAEPDIKAWSDGVALNPARIPSDYAGSAELTDALQRLQAHGRPGLARLADLSGVDDPGDVRG